MQHGWPKSSQKVGAQAALAVSKAYHHMAVLRVINAISGRDPASLALLRERLYELAGLETHVFSQEHYISLLHSTEEVLTDLQINAPLFAHRAVAAAPLTLADDTLPRDRDCPFPPREFKTPIRFLQPARSACPAAANWAPRDDATGWAVPNPDYHSVHQCDDKGCGRRASRGSQPMQQRRPTRSAGAAGAAGAADPTPSVPSVIAPTSPTQGIKRKKVAPSAITLPGVGGAGCPPGHGAHDSPATIAPVAGKSWLLARVIGSAVCQFDALIFLLWSCSFSAGVPSPQSSV